MLVLDLWGDKYVVDSKGMVAISVQLHDFTFCWIGWLIDWIGIEFDRIHIFHYGQTVVLYIYSASRSY